MNLIHLNPLPTTEQTPWLQRAEPIHRELRPKLRADYPAQVAELFADGAEMLLASEGEQVLGVAVFRVFACTWSGRRMYVDDLVTSASQRSQGVGHAMLDWLQTEARQRGASHFTLDSGTHRTDAHRFYFREGLTIGAFNFDKALT